MCFRYAILPILLLAIDGCGKSGTPQQPSDEACERHLRGIGSAVAKYRQIHGDLRPFTLGPDGIRHSWRALVTPYLKTEDASKIDYRFSEPWNSPHNRQTLPDMVMQFYFSCTAERHDGPFPYPFTSYLMLVRSARDGSEGEDAAMDSLPGDAVLIVESANSGIQFAEPRDLSWEDLWKGDSPFGKGKLNSFHPNVVKALRVDGNVVDIPRRIGKDELRKLLNGGTGK